MCVVECYEVPLSVCETGARQRAHWLEYVTRIAVKLEFAGQLTMRLSGAGIQKRMHSQGQETVTSKFSDWQFTTEI